MLRAFAAACAAPPLLAVAVAAATGAPAAQAPPAPAPARRGARGAFPRSRSARRRASSRRRRPAGRACSRGPTSPAGRGGPWPATATLGPQQWSVDPATGHLVCDGQGGHEWLRLRPRDGDAAFHVEWRFSPVEGADKYNSGVFARTATDLSVWHQAQVGLEGGFLFGVTPRRRRRQARHAGAGRGPRPAGRRVEHLRARGPRAHALTLWVNGAVTSEIAVDVPRGHFGLEAEGWRIEFRNLKIKALD